MTTKNLTIHAGSYFDEVIDLTGYRAITAGATLKMRIARAPGYEALAEVVGGIGDDGTNVNGVVIIEDQVSADWASMDGHYQITLHPKTKGLGHLVQQGRCTIKRKL